MTYLEEYYGAIIRGEIIAGRELIDELENLVQDMRSGAWIYDTKDAQLRILFMEKFVKLTKSPYYGKPMKLMLWQKAFIEALYSFKEPGTGFDRFKKAILLIARKNTKTETCGALGFAELMVGNAGADIACCSNDDAQARIMFETIATMREQFDPRGRRSHQNIMYIKNKATNSKVFRLTDRTRNKEGRNIDVAFLDESHEMRTNSIAESAEQSQSLKDNPKFINITTEGFINDGYLDNELEYARKVINREIEDNTLLPWLYTQDSETEIWQDPRSWQKSNPTLGIVKKRAYLEERLNKARHDKASRMFTLAKDFNIKQNNVQAWLAPEDYIYPARFDIAKFRGCYCLGAVDLSETTDLTAAKALLMRKGDPTKYIVSRYFIPESKLKNTDDRAAGAKYEEWAKAGFVDIAEGNENDLTKPADWFLSLYKNFGIIPMIAGYDQRFARDYLKRMERNGIKNEMVLQNRYTMSNAMKLVEADLKSQYINYNENPVDQWNFGNAAMSMDGLGQVMAVKVNNQPSKRIDGTVCLIILYEIYRRYKSEFSQHLKEVSL